MRMWMTPPQMMCRKHLLGEHVELHMFVSTLRLGKQVGGYVEHNCIEPLAIERRHKALVEEMKRRGYNHASPLADVVLNHLPDNHLFAVVDRKKSLDDLVGRCVKCRELLEEMS